MPPSAYRVIAWEPSIMIDLKISFQIKPLKKKKKIASPENLTTKKRSTGPSLYYNKLGSYDCL